MNYSVFTIPPFDKQLKKLAKKYPSLKNEYAELIESLEAHPEQGTALGQNCYKIRFAIKSKGKGKRAGARVIINVLISDSIVYLLTIYDKSDKENLTNKELEELLQFIED